MSFRQSAVGDALIVFVECSSILWREDDDEIVGMRFEVLDKRGDAISIGGFERVQQYHRHHLMEIADEIARQREHESGDLTFACCKMVGLAFMVSVIEFAIEMFTSVALGLEVILRWCYRRTSVIGFVLRTY